MSLPKKRGFTMVETTLVLAISAATLIAFIVTISTRVGRERYKDSTNSFVDFMRRMYSETINVENGRSGSIEDQNDYCTIAGQYQQATDPDNATKNPDSDGYPGRSGCAIYGKLITFGENYGTTDEDKRMVYAYDVIGRAIDISHPLSTSGDIVEQLAAVNADVLTFVKNDENSYCSVRPVGVVEKYDPAWSSTIETVKKNEPYKGAVLIVRSPSSGAVHTYVIENTELSIQRIIEENVDQSCSGVVSVYDKIKPTVHDYLKNGSFKAQETNFCIGTGESFMAFAAARRNNVRLAADGHNSTAVELVETDLLGEGGNQCE